MIYALENSRASYDFTSYYIRFNVDVWRLTLAPYTQGICKVLMRNINCANIDTFLDLYEISAIVLVSSLVPLQQPIQG